MTTIEAGRSSNEMSTVNSPENFAKLFCPKAALFNKISILTIDDLQYVSFPCSCAEELSQELGGSGSSTDVITLFNVVVATVRESAMRKLRDRRLIPSSDDPASVADMPSFDQVAVAMGLAGKVVHVDSIKR